MNWGNLKAFREHTDSPLLDAPVYQRQNLHLCPQHIFRKIDFDPRGTGDVFKAEIGGCCENCFSENLFIRCIAVIVGGRILCALGQVLRQRG